MVLFFQVPLTDIREFVKTYTWKIHVPSWPRPIFSNDNDKQDWFVRQFGKIKPRRKGGVPGWLGEDEICDAKNAIKIKEIPPYLNGKQKINIRGVARHFFFDGHAVGKYEFVFATTTKGQLLSSQRMQDFVQHFLNLQVAPTFNKKNITALYLAGNNLSKAYSFSTTKSKRLTGITGYWIKSFNNNWINSGAPVLFIECLDEETEFPTGTEKNLQVKQISIPTGYNAELFHILYPIGNRFVRLWLLKKKNNHNAEKLRTLRLYIMRLNSEYESIKYVLSQIQLGKIKYERTKKGNSLETYLNEATLHISRMENKAKSITETDEVEDLSKISFDNAYPGSANSLLTKIKNMRPQIYKKVEKIIQEIYNIKGDYIMGDKTNLNGDFQGAVINIKSDLKDVAINIQSSNGLNQDTKSDIEKLIKELDEALKKVPKEHKEDAEAVASTAKHLIETATKEKPNKTEIKISAEGLIKAASNLVKVMPIVLTIAKQLADLIVK